MKFTPIRKFQDGGAMGAPMEEQAPQEMPAEGAAPQEAPQGGGDPLMQVAQLAMQALQSQDCQAAMQVCQIFLQLIEQAQGGGGATPAPQGEPVYRRGGILVRRKW